MWCARLREALLHRWATQSQLRSLLELLMLAFVGFVSVFKILEFAWYHGLSISAMDSRLLLFCCLHVRLKDMD